MRMGGVMSLTVVRPQRREALLVKRARQGATRVMTMLQLTAATAIPACVDVCVCVCD